MADLGVPEDVKEYFDPDDESERKMAEFTNLMKNSKKAIVFTGAGVSTSAGIPDFRGPQGVWTLRAQGKRAARSPGTYGPTATHMAIVKLMEAGYVKYLVSQNTDGLHLRSGVPQDRTAELHGNTNKEECMRCGKRYIRPYHVRTAYDVHDHKTGNKCEACGGPLKDTIINFNESLPRDEISKAYQWSEEADLGIVLGSSMRVSPANELPQIVYRNGHPLMIVNLQTTPLDPLARVRIFRRTDEVMIKLLHNLGLELPPPRDIAKDPKPYAPPDEPRTKALGPVEESREDLMRKSPKELREMLRERNIGAEDCFEKGDLVDKVIARCSNCTYYVPIDKTDKEE